MTQHRTVRRRLTALTALFGFAMTAALANPPSAPAQEKKPVFSKQKIVEQLKHSTCWILGKRKGSSRYVPSGTGWVVDKKDRLVVTNHHVIDKYESLVVHFPVKENGEWVNDKQQYLKRTPIKAAVIDFADQKKDADLALLQLEKLPDGVTALKLATKSAPQGGQLHSLGASTLASNALWTYTFGHVRLTSKTKLLPSARRLKIMEAQMETNKGNSGGPVVNDHLELVAVVRAHWDKFRGYQVRNVSLYIDVTEVAAFVKTARGMIDPKTAEEFYRRGSRRYELRKYTDAIRDLSKAIAKDPKLTDAYIKRGLAFMRNGDYRTALADIDDVIKKTGGHADAYYARSLINRALKKPTDELTDLTNAIRMKPGSWEYYYYRGRHYFNSGKYSDAYNDFAQSTRKTSTQYLPHFYYAYSLMKLNRNSESVTAFSKALRLNPTDPVAHNNMGVAYYNLKQYKSAAKKFEDAIKVNSRYSMYHGNLGLAKMNLRDYRGAVSAFDKAITLFGQAKYYSSRGRSKYYLKQYDDAIKDLSKAIKLEKSNADYYYYRGQAYEGKKFKFSASSDFRRAASLNKTKYGYLLKKKTKKSSKSSSSSSSKP